MNPFTPVIAAVMLLTQHSQMPAGMSHEQHLQEMQREEAAKKRGADAMGFDQDATVHHFTLTPTGGAIEVTVKDRADIKSLAAVRAHLRLIADEFANGRFDKPLQTHGEVPPGVAAMQSNAGAIAFHYDDVAAGGAVRITTNVAELVQAVHAFLRYQITEHHTGDALDVKR